MRYFFFGTLRDLDVLKIVLNWPVDYLNIQSAYLNGYRTRLAVAEPYPVLEKCTDRRVEGIVVQGFTPSMSSAAAHVSSHFEYYPDIDWEYRNWSETDKSILRVLTKQWMKHQGCEDLSAADAEWDRTREAPEGYAKKLRGAV